LRLAVLLGKQLHQSKLVEDFATVVLTYETLALDVL
jgi:hypothetical protein